VGSGYLLVALTTAVRAGQGRSPEHAEQGVGLAQDLLQGLGVGQQRSDRGRLRGLRERGQNIRRVYKDLARRPGDSEGHTHTPVTLSFAVARLTASITMSFSDFILCCIAMSSNGVNEIFVCYIPRLRKGPRVCIGRLNIVACGGWRVCVAWCQASESAWEGLSRSHLAVNRSPELTSGELH